MNIIDKMLLPYSPQSENELLNALKEIFQEVVLLGLYRGNFFEKAVFYGGTALRILYGLERFSEDLDFSLREKNINFSLEDYFPFVIDEFEALGIKIALIQKEKRRYSNIKSAFLKNDTSIHVLDIQANGLQSIPENKKIKIKLEIDTNPPLKFQSETKTLLMPMTFNVQTMTLPSLFAGKMHALLYRTWKNRVKGRDWFDFEWYVKNEVSLDLVHLHQRMLDSKNFNKETLTKGKFLELLRIKIDTLNINQAINEVKPFVKDWRVFEFWTKEYFHFLANKITIKE